MLKDNTPCTNFKVFLTVKFDIFKISGGTEKDHNITYKHLFVGYNNTSNDMTSIAVSDNVLSLWTDFSTLNAAVLVHNSLLFVI